MDTIEIAQKDLEILELKGKLMQAQFALVEYQKRDVQAFIEAEKSKTEKQT